VSNPAGAAGQIRTGPMEIRLLALDEWYLYHFALLPFQFPRGGPGVFQSARQLTNSRIGLQMALVSRHKGHF
jgi:hypothetical protein